MSIDLKYVHIGREIDKRRESLNISKSELGRRINVPQQHINRILEKETIDTGRLAQISKALDMNFFQLYCAESQYVSAYLSAVTLNGDANNAVGDTEIASQLAQARTSLDEKAKMLEEKEETIHNLKEEKKRLQESVDDKALIITLLQEKLGETKK